MKNYYDKVIIINIPKYNSITIETQIIDYEDNKIICCNSFRFKKNIFEEGEYYYSPSSKIRFKKMVIENNKIIVDNYKIIIDDALKQALILVGYLKEN